MLLKYKEMVSKERYYEWKEAGLCVKCGKARGNSESNVKCQICHDKFKAQRKRKKRRKKVKDIESYDPSQICLVCRTVIEDFDVGCRKCQSRDRFTQKDAVKKLNTPCPCGQDQLEELCIASSDPNKPMSIYGTMLYRALCQSLKPLPGYRIVCKRCYWLESVNRIKKARSLFESQGSVDLSVDAAAEADIIDIDYETT